MEPELVAFHDNNFCKSHVSYASLRTHALQRHDGDLSRKEEKKKKKSQNLNPGYTAWVISSVIKDLPKILSFTQVCDDFYISALINLQTLIYIHIAQTSIWTYSVALHNIVRVILY